MDSLGESLSELFPESALNDDVPFREGEPQRSYLLRSTEKRAAEMRSLLESWLGRFPKEGRAELAARLRSRRNEQFDSAFFELYVHELLMGCGLTSEVHPQVCGSSRRPDFLASCKRRPRAYVEATVALESSEEERSGNARIADLLNVLSSTERDDFFVLLDFC